MSHTGFSWSDEQAAPAAVKAQGGKAFAWSDEADEKNAGATTESEMPQIGVNHGAPPQPSPGLDYSRGHAPIGEHRNYSGGFLDRAESTFGEDLNHPSNFLPSPRALLGAPGIAYDIGKEGLEKWEHRNDPQPDPAETAGHLGIPILSGLVTHAADAIGNPVEAAPVRPEPAWKTAPTEGTEVPSILNRQPYAQPGRTVFPAIGNPVEAAPPATLAPGQAGSMVESVAPPDPILQRLRANAARIAEQGHGDELSDEPEATPISTNLNEDLTPALKKSLAKVRAAKRIAATH